MAIFFCLSQLTLIISHNPPFCFVAQIVCAVSRDIYHLQIEGDSIKVKSSKEMPHEVACLDIASWPSESGAEPVMWWKIKIIWLFRYDSPWT